MNWQQNVNDVLGSYFCDCSVAEGAAELVFVSEDNPEYHHLYLSALDEGIKIAVWGGSEEKAELITILRRSNLAAAIVEEAHGLLEEIRSEYMRQYHSALASKA